MTSWRPLKSVVRLNREVLPESFPADEVIRYIEIGDVNEVDGVESSTEYVFGAAPSRARRVVHAGDVLVSTVRTYLRAVGAVPGELDGTIASTGFAVLTPSDVDARFLRYLALDRRFLDEVEARSTGVSYPAINASELVRIHVRVPSREEQRAIADFLDRETAQIDAFIAENEKLIALLTERRAAAIARELEAAQDSEDVALRVVLRAIEQGESPQAEVGLAEAEGSVGVLKAGCVNGGVYRATEHKVLPPSYHVKEHLLVTPGDLVVNRASGSVNLLGSAALVTPSPYRLMLSDKTFRLVPNSLATREYLYWVLNSARYRRQVASSVSGAEGLANNLPISVLRAIRVPLVPPARQQEVVRHLSEVSARADEALVVAREAIWLARERRAAVISSAVTGRLNLTEGT